MRQILATFREANLYTHLNLSQLQIERRRSLAGARDDMYVFDYQEEESAIRNDILFLTYFSCESPILPPMSP